MSRNYIKTGHDADICPVASKTIIIKRIIPPPTAPSVSSAGDEAVKLSK